MELRERYSYKDREGTIWDCYLQYGHGGWARCYNRADGQSGLFTSGGFYADPSMPVPYDLVEDLGETDAAHREHGVFSGCF